MHTTVADMLVDGARRFGRKPLVIANDRTLTFGEMDELSARLALALRSLGIRRGDPVTLWMENGWRWMIAYYAVLKLGAVANPCNIQLTAEEVSFIANDCGSKAIIASRVKAHQLSTAASRVLIFDTPAAGSDQPDIESLLSSTAADGERPVLGTEGLEASSPATICYTSGTTGYPKGAVLRHSTIVMNTAMTAMMHGRTQNDLVVSALPCTHVYGNIVMNTAVLCGMTLALLPRFDVTAALEAIQSHRATLFEGVPTMFMNMLNSSQFDTFDLSSLRICTVGGQTMPLAKMQETERRFGCPLLELWGMTELGGLGTTHPHNGPRRLGSIGVALPFTEARVVAMNDPSRELPRGEVGELMIRGPLVMEGYFANAEATRATIEPDGWMHTGDLVRQDAEGYFYLVDRAKEVIISGGYNVYPAEVERVIAQHPAVAMVAVAAMADVLKGQSPKAFVVAKSGTRCTGEEIIEHCRAHLAPYKLPKAVEFLPDLPKTSTGKILRRALATATP
jgi:long-chain acyl-CoA synthetase